ncbi:tetratricopeptide repeat protein [Silanimonas sp.]|uniref:tetratricopeptide repeat protein n=1 Tax=Silanimonas sp. TaxID=1929290 RepID=UPI001BBB84FB|nr:tetratricopeptide repeat protein [Silanimonas sp.]MBS3896128.1 tetratricopeptide repeat protein [Silanimonas sp.]MBS3923822.1 tetratricopeptide repeat protein [Xanthomonadaceae bacterium]
MRRPETAAKGFSIAALAVLLAACATAPPQVPGTGTNAIALRSINAAQELLQRGRLDEALEQAQIAVRADPRSGRALVAKGQVLDAQGQRERAGELLARAVQLSPQDGIVLNARGAWLCRHGDAKKGLDLLGRAIEDPTYRQPVQALANAGTCALGEGLLPTAEMNFRAALGLSPTDAQSLVGMAHVELKQGDTLGARAFLQRREALAPLTPAELLLAIRIEEAAGDARAVARYRAQLATQGQGGPLPPPATPRD